MGRAARCVLTAVLLVLAANSVGERQAVAAAGRRQAPVLPPPNARFDYQIGGAYPPGRGVAIVDRDRTDPPAPGAYGICYVNAFQTQPGDDAWWKRRHRDLLLRQNGRYVTDPGYPDEILLDVGTTAKRTALAHIVGRWVDGCATSGYQAVEPDNLDSWTRSQRRLTPADDRAFASLLVRRAHAAGLAIAQKNAAELAPVGHTGIGFDFAIAEECHVYRECAAYRSAYGDLVYEIEYPDAGGPANFRAACAALGARLSITYRDRDVVARGRPGYVFRSC